MIMKLNEVKNVMKVRFEHLYFFLLEMGGTYDYFDEKDRWQFLSKEL